MKFIKIQLLDKEGRNIFEKITVPDSAAKIFEVTLIEHKEEDKILDICKSK